ncbi:hypothetical protein HMPREF9072_00816 [Capnocytophaga sp. oral taxon 324 str. F0483]|nr:hypothetical protein HMPREF9072_00816 [Capnocytophaga sp. oral taxon 324 str. F0483]
MSLIYNFIVAFASHLPLWRGLGGGYLFEEASDSWVCVREEGL